MYVLVYAPHGIVGEAGSEVILTDTYRGALYEMNRQVRDYVKENMLSDDDFYVGSDHATAELTSEDAPEWHIYEA